MVNRVELARLWQSILQTDPDQLFGRQDANSRLVRRPDSGDEIPQPGFVGSEYQPGGVLFIAKNPAKGELPLNTLEERHVQTLRSFKSSHSDSLPESFETLMKELVHIMSEWHMVRNYVRPIISKAGVELESVAFLNLFKWRSDDVTRAMFRRSWQAHTGEQYRLLRPALVIAVGKGTADIFGRVSEPRDTTDIKLRVLERGPSDRQRPPIGTIRLIPEIAQDIREHYGSRHNDERKS